MNALRINGFTLLAMIAMVLVIYGIFVLIASLAEAGSFTLERLTEKNSRVLIDSTTGSVTMQVIDWRLLQRNFDDLIRECNDRREWENDHYAQWDTGRTTTDLGGGEYGDTVFFTDKYESLNDYVVVGVREHGVAGVILTASQLSDSSAEFRSFTANQKFHWLAIGRKNTER